MNESIKNRLVYLMVEYTAKNKERNDAAKLAKKTARDSRNAEYGPTLSKEDPNLFPNGKDKIFPSTALKVTKPKPETILLPREEPRKIAPGDDPKKRDIEMQAKPKPSTAVTVAGPNLKHMGSVNPEGKPEHPRHGAFDEPPKTPEQREKGAKDYFKKRTGFLDAYRGIRSAYRAGGKVVPKVDPNAKPIKRVF